EMRAGRALHEQGGSRLRGQLAALEARDEIKLLLRKVPQGGFGAQWTLRARHLARRRWACGGGHDGSKSPGNNAPRGLWFRGALSNPLGPRPGVAPRLEHDAEKWVPVFGKHHAPAIS